MAVNKVVLKSGKVLMDTSGVTVTPGTLYKGKTALNAAGELIEGNMEQGEIHEVEQAVPQISVSSGGLIVASAAQEGGYVAEGAARAELQLETRGAAVITPSDVALIAVETGIYTTGDVIVKGDANLKEENIAEGVSIFGKVGTHRGGTGSSPVGEVMLMLSTSVEENSIGEVIYCMLENGSIKTVNDLSPAATKGVYAICGSFVAVRLNNDGVTVMTGSGAEVIRGIYSNDGSYWFVLQVTVEPGEAAWYTF